MKIFFISVMLLLSMCGCVDNKQTLHETILLKHQVNSLEHVSDYIDNGYDGIEFDLHITVIRLFLFTMIVRKKLFHLQIMLTL